MKRIFITHIAPKEKIVEYGVSPAACNFCYNLIDNGVFDKVYSILPPFVNGKKEFKNTDCIDYIYSSYRWGNRISRKIAPVIENISLFKKIEKGCSVWFYNITRINIICIILLRLFKPSVKINVIVLDFTPGGSFSKIFSKEINRCNGRILLSNSKLFNKENSAILPGVTPESSIEYPIIEKINNEFLISGVLNENIAMLSVLLPAFSKMPNLTLNITGKIDDDTIVKDYAKRYKNIVYHGLISYEKYIALLSKVTYVFSMRNPVFPENQCNFPSKIIESLLYNRIIISTLHYEQLNDIRYFEVPTEEKLFIEAINTIVNSDEMILLEYANQSNSIKSLTSSKVWKSTLDKIENYEKSL